MIREGADAPDATHAPGVPDPRVAAWRTDWAASLPVRSPDDEDRLLSEVRDAVAELQAAVRGGAPAGHALHPHGILDTEEARLDLRPDVPEPLQVGPFLPGVSWPVRLRLSSASPAVQSEASPDQRGIAVHIVEGARRLDLLATTGEAHHARDAPAMIASLRAAAVAARGGPAAKVRSLVRLARTLGPVDAARMVRTVTRARQSGVSLAALDYHSRAPFQLGRYAVRYRLAALRDADPSLRGTGKHALREDLRARLAEGPVTWTFELQGYLDPARTPMDDHRVAWNSPWVPIGDLVLEGAGAPSKPARFRAEPAWPDPAGPILRPLGDLNRLRAAAYAASRAGRGAPEERGTREERGIRQDRVPGS